jgi:hypothetical protein
MRQIRLLQASLALDSAPRLLILRARSLCRTAHHRWYSPAMRKVGVFVLFALLPFSSSVFAELQCVTTSAAVPTEAITLGSSVATLSGPWKFAPGDSPGQNGSPLKAQPSFDDTGGATHGSRAEGGLCRSCVRHAGFVPGWTADSARSKLTAPSRSYHLLCSSR